MDTSAWIEWLIDSPTGRLVHPSIPARQDWLVPAMVQLELAKWLNRQVGEDEADRVVGFTQKCVVVSLDTSIAVSAADMCRAHRLPTADAVIYATARQYDADLLTCDALWEGLPRVTYIAKIA